MDPLAEIKNLIEQNLADSAVTVSDMTGTGDHLEILVVCDAFKDKMLIDQHQMIMDILKEPLKEKVHAVKIKTMTKETFQNRS